MGENAWFSPRFNSYVSATSSIPEDHHLLAALTVPRGLFVVENDIDWLGPVSTTGAMKAGRLIYKAYGVPNHMGFSLVGGHSRTCHLACHAHMPILLLPRASWFRVTDVLLLLAFEQGGPPWVRRPEANT